MLKFICYPKCTTCQKAKKWLDDNGVEYELPHAIEHEYLVDKLRGDDNKADVDHVVGNEYCCQQTVGVG